MALRVLLADESSTIKKVFQLALQDFAVQVTAVNVGIDVEQVAQKIKPDIIFADVILQKKNGYDVCRDIKSNPELSHIPVVLIWSGFMELDTSKFKACGANANLEKPFDAKRLRQVIQNLVEKTKTQPLSDFLTFPKLPDFEEAQAPQPAIAMPPAQPAKPTSPTMAASPSKTPTHSGSWTMDNFESIEHSEIPPIPDALSAVSQAEDVDEDFIAVELPTEPPRPPALKKPNLLTEDSADNDAQWVQKTLSNYRLDPSKNKEDSVKVKYKIPEDKIDADSVITNVWGASETKTSIKNPPPPLPNENESEADEDDLLELDLAESVDDSKSTSIPNLSTLDEKQLEAIIRAQSAEIIEKVVWQVVPEIATRIIERELERLLKERDAR
ncbi:MAG: response regulator [Bdellovibrionales bacterium]|nr:response regulator [Bdellovibrionales bacterium]